MKRQAHTVIALLVLIGSMAVAAQAQANGRAKMIANVPFRFSVGDRTLPPGEYTLRVINPTADHAILQLRSSDGESVMLQMNDVVGKDGETARLVFNRYGNRYFFAQAWVDGDNTGMQAAKSKTERAAETELAGLKPGTETIAVRNR
jgi:hypothetical protein